MAEEVNTTEPTSYSLSALADKLAAAQEKAEVLRMAITGAEMDENEQAALASVAGDVCLVLREAKSRAEDVYSARRKRENGDELARRIEAHEVATDYLMRLAEAGGDLPEGSTPFKDETAALLALLSYPTRTIDDVRRKASYLIGTGYAKTLKQPELALLFSMLGN